MKNTTRRFFRLAFPVILSLAAAFHVTGSAPSTEPDPGASDPAAAEALCPVCRVHDGETEPEPILASVDYQGQVYGFCSDDCRDAFLEDPEGYVPPVFPRPAPAFKIRDLDGDEVSSAEFGGRVVLLDFWATWCPPCVKDLPALSALHERFADSGFAVVSVSIDDGDDAARKVARMVKKRQASHPVYLDSLDAPAWGAFHVRVVPTQYLLDAGGNVVDQWSGKIDLAVVEAAVAELVGPPAG